MTDLADFGPISWQGTVLHPVGVAVLVLIQWYALARRAVGRPVAWKARAASYDASRSGRVRA